jgi:hypothetical protein
VQQSSQRNGVDSHQARGGGAGYAVHHSGDQGFGDHGAPMSQDSFMPPVPASIQAAAAKRRRQADEKRRQGLGR